LNTIPSASDGGGTVELPLLPADARPGAKPGGREPGYRQTRQHRPHCAEDRPSGARGRRTGGAWTNLFISQDQVAKIIADDRVQGAALTGSEKAGSVVAAQAAKHIKKSTLELGGNDVFVVLDDADLAKAVKIGVQARLNNAGQVCTAAKRFILHEKIADV
jgi:succinate-semialdehyde dehydrogenase/glutarate-semialdehyde dehydrogenase